jgi:hypothetical protein
VFSTLVLGDVMIDMCAVGQLLSQFQQEQAAHAALQEAHAALQVRLGFQADL